MSLNGFWTGRIYKTFTTTYLCESRFSHLVMIKTKYKNLLDSESEIKVKPTKLLLKSTQFKNEIGLSTCELIIHFFLLLYKLLMQLKTIFSFIARFSFLKGFTVTWEI